MPDRCPLNLDKPCPTVRMHAARLLAHADQHTPPQQPREDES